MSATSREPRRTSSNHPAQPEVDPNSAEGLAQLRHSCAHVMAQAVVELFPGTKIAIGPAIEDGFYYDFDSEHRFTIEDLAKIEARMREIVKGDHEFRGQVMDPAESRRYWEKRGEPYKLEILEGLQDQPITHYTHDTFTDLCRGGHVSNTRAIRHFKLLSVAGAYWRGDERNKMLQRLYATAWTTQDQLAEHLRRLEEAKRRDHRKLGAELDLFSVHEDVGGGLIHWHPKGAVVRFQVETYLRALLESDGYQFVYTPHVASERLYQRSGHLENYADLMYGPMEIEGNPFRAKPMNCPNHIMIFKSRLHSYRELPIRLAEFGTVYRFEKSGVLHGLLRVRGFTVDDAHIFCRMDQIQDEIAKLLRLVARVYRDFGFLEIQSFLSTRPERSVGDPELWSEAERMLRAALDGEGFRYELDPGGGAFYGPKIDIKIKDAIGRQWQLGTVQLDFNLPRRFDVRFRNEKGGEDYAVMIHRAIFGSIERFLGVLIEHYAGNFPLWLAPVQVKVLTINSMVEPAARELEGRLRQAGLRPELDAGTDKVGYKVRKATLERVPYMAVLGPKDVAAGTVSVRLRDGRQAPAITPEELIHKLLQETREKSLASLLVA